MNIFKKFDAWFEKWFGPSEFECSQCGEKYMVIPGITHKCNLKTIVKKAILEAEEEKLKIK